MRSDAKSEEIHSRNGSLYFTYLITFVYILCIHPFAVWVLTSTLLETAVISAEFRHPCCCTSLSRLLLLVPSTEKWNVEVWQIYIQSVVWIVSMKIWCLVSLWVWQSGGQQGACVMQRCRDMKQSSVMWLSLLWTQTYVAKKKKQFVTCSQSRRCCLGLRKVV